MKVRTYRSKTSTTRKGNRVYRKQETDSSRNRNSPVGNIMFLQRTMGNQAVMRMLQGSGVGIQAKLKIGQPNDIYEQEADRVAEQVMKMSENTVGSSQLSGVRKENESVQRKPT